MKTSEAGTAYPLGSHMFSPPVLSGVRVTRSLVLCVMFVDRCLSFFVWPWYYLSFFDLPILITPLVYLQTFLTSGRYTKEIMHGRLISKLILNNKKVDI